MTSVLVFEIHECTTLPLLTFSCLRPFPMFLGLIECYEFIRALSRGDDYDRAIGGGGGGGLGGGRLNPDGSLKVGD